MCEMLNVFVPLPEPAMGPPIRGLAFSRSGEIQKDFAERWGPRGTILSGSAGSCLCGFDDWAALYAAARDLLSRNRIQELAALRFWSRDRYELASRAVDPDDPESCTPLVMGEVVVMHVEPPEKRRHRLVVRGLTRVVGAEATLRLKNGRELHGIVTTFDAESETGIVDGTPFVAAQVLAVDE